ncbi:hypothetical protein MKZ38_008293 [Zalerion maritima]|uniref:Uncharacterized protein n=1 Tax=Zalerion maritima TaxID=339359 RepID=A0AAD5RHN6_9PEZI|nr:hypothetical protein MKZ38_008293 [Zalerion maritima]
MKLVHHIPEGTTHGPWFAAIPLYVGTGHDVFFSDSLGSYQRWHSEARWENTKIGVKVRGGVNGRGVILPLIIGLAVYMCTDDLVPLFKQRPLSQQNPYGLFVRTQLCTTFPSATAEATTHAARAHAQAAATFQYQPGPTYRTKTCPATV